jgi:hypothetical protein
MFNLPEMALVDAAGLGVYELYHHHQYGNGYGSLYGYNNMGFGGHHHFF